MCFDYGFGPFRWVCASNKEEDLQKTDRVLVGLEKLLVQAPEEIKLQTRY